MQSTRFWKLMAAAAVGGLWYLGLALQPAEIEWPQFTSQAYADTRLYSSPEPRWRGDVSRGFRWEQMSRDARMPLAYRAEVQGGWLIATLPPSGGGSTAVHTVFVPDISHRWELD